MLSLTASSVARPTGERAGSMLTYYPHSLQNDANFLVVCSDRQSQPALPCQAAIKRGQRSSFDPSSQALKTRIICEYSRIQVSCSHFSLLVLHAIIPRRQTM